MKRAHNYVNHGKCSKKLRNRILISHMQQYILYNNILKVLFNILSTLKYLKSDRICFCSNQNNYCDHYRFFFKSIRRKNC